MEEKQFKTRIIEEFHVVCEITVEKENLPGLVANLIKLHATSFEIRRRPKYPCATPIAKEDK